MKPIKKRILYCFLVSVACLQNSYASDDYFSYANIRRLQRQSERRLKKKIKRDLERLRVRRQKIEAINKLPEKERIVALQLFEKQEQEELEKNKLGIVGKIIVSLPLLVLPTLLIVLCVNFLTKIWKSSRQKSSNLHIRNKKLQA